MAMARDNMWHDLIRLGLVRIFYPCLMIFGTIGNILCLKILLRKRFRRQSTCQYLCILAVIDILFIYMRSTRYLYRYIFEVDLRNTSLWICRSFIFFSSVLSYLASWLLVIVSFDRYLIVKHLFPYRHVGWRVFKSTCILFIMVFLLNSHYFYILGKKQTNLSFSIHVFLGVDMSLPVQTEGNISNATLFTFHFICVPREQFEKFFRYYLPISDLLFVAILPCILLIFTNIGIIRAAMRSSLLCITSRKQKRNNRLTIMLLSVILAFILLTCPSVIYICLNRLIASKRVSDRKLVILDVLESLWYTKHALNFILYTLSGQDFRREFRRLISCSKRSTSNSSRSHRSGENNHLVSMQSRLSSYRSLSIRTYSKKRQSSYIDNHLPVMLPRKIDESENGMDGTYALLTARSTNPSPSSITSEQRET